MWLECPILTLNRSVQLCSFGTGFARKRTNWITESILWQTDDPFPVLDGTEHTLALVISADPEETFTYGT